MPTCVELSGAEYPLSSRGQSIQPMEGVSLVPAFAGMAINRQKPIYWEHEGNRAIRDGDWKLVSKHPGGWELYDIVKDRTEMHDLAKTHPERVKGMTKQWESWASRVGVLPWPIAIRK